MSEFFPGVPKIAYGGPKSRNPLEFKHYNADEVVGGKTMKDHLRFSVVYWHTFSNPLSDPFGAGTAVRPWDDGSHSVANAQQQGARRPSSSSRRSGPRSTPSTTATSPPRARPSRRATPTSTRSSRSSRTSRRGPASSSSGARPTSSATPATCTARPPAPTSTPSPTPPPRSRRRWRSPTTSAALGYTFWGGREGYSTLLNTDMKRELDHLARFLHMAVDYKKQIGFAGPFYIEPKPKEPTKHQYDSDAAACLNFLRTYDLLPHFKLNLETNHATLAGHEMMHELEVAAGAGALGLDRRQHRRPAARLGHRPVPDEHLPDRPVHAGDPRAWAGSPPAASTSTPRSAARASSRSTCSTPTSAGWTPSPAASRSPTRSSPTAGSPAFVKERYKSWDSELGRRVESRPGQLRRPRGVHPAQGRGGAGTSAAGRRCWRT